MVFNPPSSAVVSWRVRRKLAACREGVTQGLQISPGERKGGIFSPKGVVYEAPRGFFPFSMKNSWSFCLLPRALVMDGALM